MVDVMRCLPEDFNNKPQKDYPKAITNSVWEKHAISLMKTPSVSLEQDDKIITLNKGYNVIWDVQCDGQDVYAVGTDGQIIYCNDNKNSKNLFTNNKQEHFIGSVVDNTKIQAVSINGKVWSQKKNEKPSLYFLSSARNLIQAVTSAHGYLITADHYGKIRAFDNSDDFFNSLTPYDEKLDSKKTKRRSPSAGIIWVTQAHNGMAHCVTANEKYVASGGYDGAIHLLDINGGWIRKSFIKHNSAVNALDMNEDSSILISGDTEGNVYLWNNNGFEKQLFCNEDSVFAIALSPNNQQAISGHKKGIVILWDIKSGKEIKRWQVGKKAIYSLKFSSDGMNIFAGGEDSTLWSWKNDKVQH
jgi:WD40 repeat protein